MNGMIEKYFGIGGPSTFAEPEREKVVYEKESQDMLPKVAQLAPTYGKSEK